MYIYVYNKNIDMYRLGSPVHTHTYMGTSADTYVYTYSYYI